MAVTGSPSFGVLPDLPVPLLVSIKKFERPPTPRYHGRPYCLLCADAGTALPKVNRFYRGHCYVGCMCELYVCVLYVCVLYVVFVRVLYVLYVRVLYVVFVRALNHVY